MHLGGNVGDGSLSDSVHTMNLRIAQASGFRFLVNRTWRRENVLKSLERVMS